MTQKPFDGGLITFHKAAMTLTAYRLERSLTLQAFADLVDVTKGRIHQIEGGAGCSPELALKIEAATSGMVSASELSPTIRAARATQVAAA